MNLEDTKPGECRWMYRHDIHVYCRHPMIAERRGGRTYWRRRPEDRRYAVACPEAGLDCEAWMTEDELIVVLDRILSGAMPAAA
jgi:hypothetical protein